MKRLLVVPLGLMTALAGAAVRRVQDQCGPFTDVSPVFCPYVVEAWVTGITAGTSPTTFSPDLPITRGQAAVFTTKALNQTLARGSRRAALGQWWTTAAPYATGLGTTTVGNFPIRVASDGADLWVANNAGAQSVSRVRASDGTLLETWTGVPNAYAVMVAMGRVFVTGNLSAVYMIDPAEPPGDATLVVNNLSAPLGLAFDGSNLWTANYGDHSVSIIAPSSTPPWTATTVSTGFTIPEGILYDGQNIWVTDFGAGALLKLDASGNVLQSVAIGPQPLFPVFDGANIWIPVNGSNSVVVVRASTGAIIATLTGNGVGRPYAAAFDGQRILVTNQVPPGLSLWNASSLAPLGFLPTAGVGLPWGLCSDGLNFWITFEGSPGQLARF